MGEKYICIHGHFYQPPRENPWLGEVEVQESAQPYHDWNHRITAECYARNAASRILDANKRIIDIINNYSKISFNFGPTLLSWMERKDPETYAAILEADRMSLQNFKGHGSAMAQVYSHMIMPLANSRDKRTQVIWGIKDFESRFRRKPEGMWLAETAVDLETLDIMAECGIKFTILAPHQAKRVSKVNDHGRWRTITPEHPFDPKTPYICTLPSGRTISIFFYDGPISQAVAFEGLLSSGENFASRLMNGFVQHSDENQLVHIATDGETYGHHHKFGDMGLAYCLYFIDVNDLVNVTIYGDYLEKYPPTQEAEIHEATSWSCAHGVERWRSNCGCRIGSQAAWHQEWRKPLRDALNWLRDQSSAVYENYMRDLLKDPWEARNAYIKVILDRSRSNVEEFFTAQASKVLTDAEKVKVLRLLEVQHNAQLMYTSCGWFFDDISGIETVQILKYAARVIQLVKDIDGNDFEPVFVNILEKAKSNISEYKNGAAIYRTMVKPSVVDLLRVGGHYALTSLFEEYPQHQQLYCYSIDSEQYERKESGRNRLAIGRGVVTSDITWEKIPVCFAVIHLGDHNLLGGVEVFKSESDFFPVYSEILKVFMGSNIPEAINLINTYFGLHNYSLWHLFKLEQQKVLLEVLKFATDEIETSFRQIYENQYSLLQIKEDIQLQLPKTLATVVEYVLNRDLCEALEQEPVDLESVKKLIAEMKRWSFERDRSGLSFVAGRRVAGLMNQFIDRPDDIPLMETIVILLRNFNLLNLELDLWKAQNIYFSMGKKFYIGKQRSSLSDHMAQRWISTFDSLGQILQVKVV